jgi:anti-sigma B factor antagonist
LAVVEIHGTIDVYTASSLGQTIQSLIEDGCAGIVLDMSSVGRLDSSGLGTLVGNAKSMASNGGAIWLVGMSYRVRKTLEITNLARYFRITDSIDRAFNESETLELSQTPS